MSDEERKIKPTTIIIIVLAIVFLALLIYLVINIKSSNKQITEAFEGYECPTDYTLNGNQCIKKIISAKTESYSCPNGYVLDVNVCRKIEISNSSYSCPKGYVLDGVKCNRISDTVSYSCPDGYTLNGNKCTRTDTKNAIKLTRQCPNNTYTYNSKNGKCEIYENVKFCTGIIYLDKGVISQLNLDDFSYSVLSDGTNGCRYIRSYADCQTIFKYTAGVIGEIDDYPYVNSDSLNCFKITSNMIQDYTKELYAKSGGIFNPNIKIYDKFTKYQNGITRTISVSGISCPDGYARDGSYCKKVIDSTNPIYK